MKLFQLGLSFTLGEHQIWVKGGSLENIKKFLFILFKFVATGFLVKVLNLVVCVDLEKYTTKISGF